MTSPFFHLNTSPLNSYRIHGREKFIIASKFGLVMTPSGIKQSGKAEVIRSQLDDSLKRLGVEYIDLYYQVSDMIMFGN